MLLNMNTSLNLPQIMLLLLCPLLFIIKASSAAKSDPPRAMSPLLSLLLYKVRANRV
jgi:hypothetical protein